MTYTAPNYTPINNKSLLNTNNQTASITNTNRQDKEFIYKKTSI